ncbi:MAG: amino acid ABC transporter substrate-binding protein [Chloroflexi bacterium]|nr:amino acid ABC transporter substrate-binding protein [Chloroflexota bacterium]
MESRLPDLQLPTSNFQLRPGTLPLVLVLVVVGLYLTYTRLVPAPPPKPDATWTRIVADGVFRIGIDPSFPPFETDDGKGHLSGLDIALAEEIAREWSQQTETPIRVQYVYTGFDGLYDALKSGQYDAILSALPYDPRKTEDVWFSHSYFNGGPLVVVREGDTAVKSFYNLRERRIGVELGSSGDTFARKWQRRLRYDLEEFNTPADALRALRLGQVDGVFTDAIAFTDFVRAEGGVKMVGNPLTDELFVMAVRKDAPTLLAQINAVIDAMKRDGRMERLQAEWF